MSLLSTWWWREELWQCSVGTPGEPQLSLHRLPGCSGTVPTQLKRWSNYEGRSSLVARLHEDPQLSLEPLVHWALLPYGHGWDSSGRPSPPWFPNKVIYQWSIQYRILNSCSARHYPHSVENRKISKKRATDLTSQLTQLMVFFLFHLKSLSSFRTNSLVGSSYNSGDSENRIRWRLNWSECHLFRMEC